MSKTPPEIAASGFREYDARWRYPDDINLSGMARMGLAFGHFVREKRASEKPQIVCGYDYRSYSEEVRAAFMSGLMEAGCGVHDIGLALSPMAYFAQGFLEADGVAMITASHNPNGWTGVKMGWNAPLTLMPEEMTRMKNLALSEKIPPARQKGERIPHHDMAEIYADSLASRAPFSRRLKIVLDCGNGTAGFFAPRIFRRLGAEVIEFHCRPDFSFPHYNPNPEDGVMLRALGAKVREAKADLGLAFDGDGDRCGFTDERGESISADKAGLLIALAMSRRERGGRFIADVKSTGLFQSLLEAEGASLEYWKTGHSYMKKRLYETGAVAAFEKSGHFFFAPPVGRFYDDGLLSGIVMAETLCESGVAASSLAGTLPATWISPTLAPPCSDSEKYDVVESVRAIFKERREVAGRAITSRVHVNGVRAHLEDGSWLLVRASSNVPSLVVVVESRRSEADMLALIAELRRVLEKDSRVGAW